MNKKYFFLSILWGNLYILANHSTSLHRYFWANYTQFSGDMIQTQNWYTKLFSSSSSPYSYKGYLTFLSDTKQFTKIIELMPTLQKKFSQDPEVQLIFVTALQETKQTKQADALIISLSQSFKTHPEIALHAAQAYVKHQEPENALLTINGFLNNTPRRPNNFVFYFLQSHIHLQLNKLAAALESIKRCLEIHPHFDKGWLLCASLYEKQGNIQEALAGYTTFLELSGNNSYIQQHVFNLMLTYKSVEDDKKQILSRSINIENALILFKQKRYTSALAHINACIQKEPQSHECKLLKIEILSAMKDFKQAALMLSTWFLEQPDNQLWPKTLSQLSYSGMPSEDIIKNFDTLLKKHPENMWCNLYCAEIYMRQQNTTAAIPYLEKALSHATNTPLAAHIAYQLALLHYENSNSEQMLFYLEKAYVFDPDCPHINNALAYYWATKGKNLTKAQSCMTKALESDNTNPYFLDTQAIIYYKEKKYAQAQNILEKLVDHNNSTILLHLAKVHHALHNKEIADTFTQKAATLVKNNQEKKALEKMKLLLAQK